MYGTTIDKEFCEKMISRLRSSMDDETLVFDELDEKMAEIDFWQGKINTSDFKREPMYRTKLDRRPICH